MARTRWHTAMTLAFLSGCGGAQSALDPAGRGAERIADLFWVMAIGAAILWLAVVILALYAARVREPARGREEVALSRAASGHGLILWAGVIAPTLVLGALLAHGLALLPPLLAPAPEGAIRIEVIGYQWWWRVRYLRDGAPPVELANELHLPVDEPAELLLESRDVIHSLWIPSLGGKVDMIPGRRTRLVLEPTKTGVFRGACAEYCGTSHAWMRLYAVVEPRAAFERWLERQAQPRPAPRDPVAARGRALFAEHGCGACHAVRGTFADGVIGPDLTHVGTRLSIGAGALASGGPAIRDFLARTGAVKPGVHMPAFGMLPEGELDALSAYLEQGGGR